jgi:hypothetical protein
MSKSQASRPSPGGPWRRRSCFKDQVLLVRCDEVGGRSLMKFSKSQSRLEVRFSHQKVGWLTGIRCVRKLISDGVP